MSKFTWWNGQVWIESNIGHLSQEFVDELDVTSIINRCFGTEKGESVMEFTDEQIEFMRQDIESGMSLTKMIEATKKRLKEQGKDFNREFDKFRKKKDAHARISESIVRHKQTRGY